MKGRRGAGRAARRRRRRAETAAHTAYMFDTDAVFHAPMFALNAAADWNACEPSHTRSTPTDGARMCRRGCVGAQSNTHTRVRARTQHVGACVRQARIGDPFVRVARGIYRYMHALGIHILCMCAPSMALRRERVALAHMPRISASSAPARDRTRMHEHTRVPIYIPGLCIDTNICI